MNLNTGRPGEAEAIEAAAEAVYLELGPECIDDDGAEGLAVAAVAAAYPHIARALADKFIGLHAPGIAEAARLQEQIEAARRAMDWRMHPDAQNMPLPLWRRHLAVALTDSPEPVEA
jgi:hypothetical protein